MLLFYADEAIDLETARRHGLQSDGQPPLTLHTSLDRARRTDSESVLVVDGTALDAPRLEGDAVRVSSVPPDALQNISPYRPPVPVTAAGGYVGRSLSDDVAILLIHRRGVWDLPKGHRDPGEALDTCALREVREEVGVEDLRILRPLGTTQHGYPDGDAYAVKTTYWYLMRTPERSFVPERREGIRRVAWARWAVARRHIGYDTLRRHMERIEPAVRKALS